jgi:hypothetical protein
MKIIDIGICIDNVDPKGIGRIRCVRYSDYVSEKEKAITYEAWSDKDPFIAIPFLPYNINYVPEIEQAVKIINYNADKEHVNVEYIAGPFTTLHDFNSQTFTQQIENTTYGVVLKETPNIIDKNDNYIDKQSFGAFAKKRDFGVYGKEGSDIIFTENGLQLRGGKLLSKEAASVSNRKKMITYPIMGKKSSVLSLKKFPKKMTLEKTERVKTTTDVKDIKSIVEYQIDSLSNPTKIEFFVYDVKSAYGEVTKTNFFNENTPKPTGNIKLLNTENDDVTPTHTILIDGNNTNNIHNEIRDFIYTIHENGLKGVNPLYKKDDIHPIYFRPTPTFDTLVPSNQTQSNLKNQILSNVKIYGVGPKSGLIYSLLNIRPSSKTSKIKTEYLKIHQNSPEQTFSALKSDKIYFLSTDTNETNKAVNFSVLDKYEYTQEDYVKNIDPNTYSTVRGENLVKLIRAMVSVLFNHQHNLTKPMVKIGYGEYDQLVNLLKSMEDDILNKSIRIN